MKVAMKIAIKVAMKITKHKKNTNGRELVKRNTVLLCSLWYLFLASFASLSWAFDAQSPAPFTLKLDGAGNQRIVESVSDLEGNLYLVGYFEASAGADEAPKINVFQDQNEDGEREEQGSFSLEGKNQGGRDIFVAKLDWLGNLQWLKTAGGSGDDVATGVVYDPRSKHIFISGYFHGLASFGIEDYQAVSAGSGLEQSATSNLFIAQLDTGGDWGDVETLPIAAAVTHNNTNVTTSVQGLHLGGSDTGLGNGLVLAVDQTNPQSDIAFYLKGQVTNSLGLRASTLPGSSQTWTAKLGLQGQVNQSLALFYRNA
ncbi:MAG: hypothetical protein KTR17_12575, partial [Cellvibrionaceae bacterium]|nr:hypothetical protein [Cellvibrionaceae bacterium]